MKLHALIAAIGIAAGGLAGCYAHARVVETGYVQPAPPPDRVEVVTEAPSREHIWARGHWRWDGRGYVWVGGRWQSRPQPYAQWVPGHWQRVEGRWLWVEGHWRG